MRIIKAINLTGQQQALRLLLRGRLSPSL